MPVTNERVLRGLLGTSVDELEGVESAATRPEVSHVMPTLALPCRPHAHERTSTAGGCATGEGGVWGCGGVEVLGLAGVHGAEGAGTLLHLNNVAVPTVKHGADEAAGAASGDVRDEHHPGGGRLALLGAHQPLLRACRIHSGSLRLFFFFLSEPEGEGLVPGGVGMMQAQGGVVVRHRVGHPLVKSVPPTVRCYPGREFTAAVASSFTDS